MADAVGPELTGIRLSPFSSFLEATDPESLDLNLQLVDKLSEMGIVYVHAVEARCAATSPTQTEWVRLGAYDTVNRQGCMIRIQICSDMCRIAGASDLEGPVFGTLEPLRKAFKVQVQSTPCPRDLEWHIIDRVPSFMSAFMTGCIWWGRPSCL